jgi:NADPH-dependent ferric siderophore reductase
MQYTRYYCDAYFVPLRALIETAVLRRHPTAHNASEERQDFVTPANCDVRWLICTGRSRGDAATLPSAQAMFDLRAGDGYIWIAAEAYVSHDLYSYFVEERGHPAQWVKAFAYGTDEQTESGEQS